MSTPGKRNAALAAGLFCCLLAGLGNQAHALDFPDALKDPLLAVPPKLDEGVRLPRDDKPLTCPSSVDLSAPLSLSDVVDLTLCRDPQIQAAWADIKIQASSVGEARSAYLPTVTGATTQLHNRVRYPGSSQPASTTQGQTVYAGLGWRLFDFGGRAANLDAANRQLTAALLSHDAALQKALTTAVGAYFDVLTAQAQTQTGEEAVRLAEQTVAVTTRRFARGAAAQSDTLQADAALAKAQLAAQRALGEQKKALSVLVYTMNLPSGTPLLLAAAAQAPTAESIQGLSYWLTQAQAQHPEILAARAQWEASKAKVTAARSEGLPTIDFTANHYRNGYPNQGLQTTRSNTTTWGIALNIPIFEGFSRTYKIRGAQAQAEQNEARLADVERRTLLEVVKAHADAVSAQENLSSSTKLLDAARAAVESSERRYAKGAADILELLQQQNALAEARRERIRCLSEWRSARLRLMASTGVLDSLSLQ
ncbi:TolC family protein [Herbaspirillum sp. LeCh32-8]|nr:TolC family protein [Herbaspirillum sp. LeCh32-8]